MRLPRSSVSRVSIALATIEHPDRLVEQAAQRQQAGIVLGIRVVLGRHDTALDEADLRFVALQAREIVQRPGRRLDLQRHAVSGQDRRVALGKLVVGTAFAAGRDDDFLGRRRFDELIGDDEADADNQENPPGGGKQVAQRQVRL
jgi:hypothetical protein